MAEVEVAWNPMLGTLPGTIAGIELYAATGTGGAADALDMGSTTATAPAATATKDNQLKRFDT